MKMIISDPKNSISTRLIRSVFLLVWILIVMSLNSCALLGKRKPAALILDMVHHNPGEPLTNTSFTNPEKLVSYGYNGQVINDFTFAHAALTFDKLNPAIFPKGSEERKWVENAAKKVRANIEAAHRAGLKVYYFTDIIVLPKKLVEIYRHEILDENGKISFEKPKTRQIHRIMLDELFETFPGLDGLIIRTGETYLNNVPYHTGNNPITMGVKSHVDIINFLREEVSVKRNKLIAYRTWNPHGFFHEDPAYYLEVTNAVSPHPNLLFSIKHTKGDYHRTFPFNPTLTIGRHQQMVEVQCQREYEGKGAYPNYVMEGVINGFEEYKTNTVRPGNQSLTDIKNDPRFKGVWTWSRGGGWKGPYIENELWCDLNAYVLSSWATNTRKTERQVFNAYMDRLGLTGNSRNNFRELCLLSAKGVIRGHSSVYYPVDSSWVWWTRDHFLAGSDEKPDVDRYASEGVLYKMFSDYYAKGLLEKSIAEKEEALAIWKKIEDLSKEISVPDAATENYIRVSSSYGYLLHGIIAEGWKVMALGFAGDKTKHYDKERMKQAIVNYDAYWAAYKKLKEENPACATLYKPYAFVYIAPEYHGRQGIKASVDKYRGIIGND